MKKTVGNRLALLTLTLMMCFPSTAMATSLDDLVNEPTTVAETMAPTEAPVVQPTEEETKQHMKSAVDETLGSGFDSSFARELAETANLSKATTQGTAFAKRVRFMCSIVFQYITALISGFFVVCVAIDVMFIVIPLTRKWLANGYVGNPVPDEQQQGQMGMPGQMGMQGQGQMGMPGQMGMQGGYGNRGLMGGRFGMGQQGMMGGAGQMGMQTAMQNQPATGRIQFVSNAALNAVAEESSSKKNPLMNYFDYVWKTAVLAMFILVLASTGVLASLGAAFALKVAEWLQSMSQSLM